MGIKQSVVVVNEFTIKNSSGGSRGGTPDNYVLQYMARKDAVEPIAPITYAGENPMMRYSRRSESVDKAVHRSDFDSSDKMIQDLKSEFRALQGNGGVAFGYGHFSLSNDELKDAADDIKMNFKKGKTVMKTVLSFDEEYLRKHKIIDEDFKLVNEGDYRGHIDQLKLRMGIMSGIDKLSRNYDDLQYIGCIQVDTKHVHCHLAMVDRGKGRLMSDGTQKGKLTDNDKAILRRGIDRFLDEKQTVKRMTANIEQDRRNTTCFVKKYTHKVMQERGFSQFLLACLPDDRNLWRAGTNRKEMQKPNAIVRSYVEDILSEPDSGYDEALDSVRRYARNRMISENLTSQQYNRLYENGKERIIEQSMNSVYSVLKRIPEDEFTVDTKMMSAMAMAYQDMANNITEDDEFMDFGFRLRSYKSRLDHHAAEKHKYHEAVKEYEQQKTDESAHVLYDYLKVEEEYNEMLMTKYQYFLDFIPSEEVYQEEFGKLLEYGERVENLDRMKDDTTIKKMRPEVAETYGQNVYGETGGYYMITKPSVFDEKVASVHRNYDSVRDDFKAKIMAYGLQLDDQNRITRHKAYDFDDVKALDLHHLMYDFPDDIDISVVNVHRFTDMADRRYDAFQKAKSYLESTGQGQFVSNFPEADINLQHALADQMRIGDTSFKSLRELTAKSDQSYKTIRLDSKYYKNQEEDIRNMIKSTVNSLQYE